jgi:hypothetical protein
VISYLKHSVSAGINIDMTVITGLEVFCFFVLFLHWLVECQIKMLYLCSITLLLIAYGINFMFSDFFSFSFFFSFLMTDDKLNGFEAASI